MFNQKAAEVPRYLANRSAVSAVIERVPWMISLIRGGGTRISLASRYWLIPKGLRNSSNRTSPGGTGGSFAACGLRVVICNLDFIGISVPPAETNPPLIVDADAVLPLIPRVDVPEREQSQGRGPHRLPCDNTQSNA